MGQNGAGRRSERPPRGAELAVMSEIGRDTFGPSAEAVSPLSDVLKSRGWMPSEIPPMAR
jgi:hypothetical protein